MQAVSGAIHRQKVHFEAPPSEQMQSQMNGFLKWFNESRSLPTLTRSGIAHQCFLSIHSLEYGNGRIGRAIVEKVIAQDFGQPSLFALLSQTEKGRNAYYHALEAANKRNEITTWLSYFAQLSLDAQKTTGTHVQFLIEKAKLYDRLRGQLNERQEQVVTRMFREEP
jgi:Fic family protein